MGVRRSCPKCGIVKNENGTFCSKDGSRLSFETTTLRGSDLGEEIEKLSARFDEMRAEIAKEAATEKEDKKDK